MRPSPRVFCLQAAGAAGVAACIIACIIAAGCGQKQDEPAPPAPVVAMHTDDFAVAHPEQFPLAALVLRQQAAAVTVSATIAAETSRTAQVVSPLQGQLTSVRVQLGDRVRAGEVLAVLRSTDLEQARADLRTDAADEQLAQTELTRAQDLLSHGAAAQETVEQARDAEVDATAKVAAGRQKIELWGASADPGPDPDALPIRAPHDGIVIAQNTSSGAIIPTPDNAQSLFTIADISEIWVECNVYEDQLAQVAVGDLAEVSVPAYPGQVFSGRVSNISGVLDPSTRTAAVRIVLANPGQELKPGMFGTVVLRSQRTQPVLLAPQDAVVRTENQSFVYVSLGQGRFHRVTVSAGSAQAAPGAPAGADPDWIPIAGAVRAGDRVVANALDFDNALADGGGS